MNDTYMAMCRYGVPMTKHRTSERNIVICMLIVYVQGAVIESLFVEFARKNNKL